MKKSFAPLLVITLLSLNIFPAYAQVELNPPLPTPEITPVTTPEATSVPTTPPVTETVAPIIAPGDTTPPVISNVAEASLLPIEATIVWSTDEVATSRLEYGSTTTYGHSVTLGTGALLVHTATILNLTAGSTYYYCIHATDITGNASQSCGHSFTTDTVPTAVDANPPTIETVTITSLTTSSATINWTTTEVANGEVEYGTTASYGAVSPFDANLAVTHAITLSNLSLNTLYHYRIASSDEAGNLAVTPDNTFTTGEIVPESTGPSTVVFSFIEAASIDTSSVTITWHTNVPSDSQVEYGDNAFFGQTSPLHSELTTTHSVTVTDLASNTGYYFRVKSKPLGGTVATVSANEEFTTLAEPTTIIAPATISAVSASAVESSTTTVTWHTDKGATSQVEYGLSTAYGQVSAASATRTTAHSVHLAHLTPDTTYHYRVRSVDEVGNITESSDSTFTTTADTSKEGVSILQPPHTITNVAVNTHDQTSATLSWQVANADADTAAEYTIRYSQEPITEANFSQAHRAQSTPVLYGDVQPNGAQRRYIVAGLTPGTRYYFALKSKYAETTWSSLSNVTNATPAFEPSGQTTDSSGANEPEAEDSAGSTTNAPFVLNGSGEDKQITLTWQNSPSSAFVRTVIVKKAGGYASSPSDGKVVYQGRSQSFTDTAVTNGKTAYYTLYSYNRAGQYSKGINVSLSAVKGRNQIKLSKVPLIIPRVAKEHFVEDLRRGHQDIEVEHLQEVLAADEDLYPEKSITGYFGALTETALKRFQAKHNLPQTGITDQATRAKLNVVSESLVRLEVPEDLLLFEKDLQYGDSGAEVAALQQFLIYEGSYSERSLTTLFDLSTKNAVTTFQKKHNVQPALGYVGPKTRHKIKAVTGL